MIRSAWASSSAVARMSTSPIVSRHRRSEPAYSTRSAASRRAPTMSVAVLRATLSSTRSWVMTARPRRMRSSLLGPNPAMFRSLPSLTAASRSLTVAMPSSLLSCMARFGPSPGTLVSSRTPGGTLARCSSTALMVPVRLNSVILAAIDLPTPGMLVSADSAIVVTSAGCPATALAAFS